MIDEPKAAIAILNPVRATILTALSEPGSATSVARQVNLPRQKVNYHLRSLEANGLIEAVDERKWGGLTERLYTATAVSYVISPEALGGFAGSPASIGDRLSAGYLVALAARAVREVGGLMARARSKSQRLATLAIDTEICFESTTERAAFAEELAEGVKQLAARYHRPGAVGGRAHRLVILAYPNAVNGRKEES